MRKLHVQGDDQPMTQATLQNTRNQEIIFRPLEFKSGLKVKNRLFRSNVSGMFDEYNGQGGNARINWEEKFAAGGVGAIVSSFSPVTPRGRILPRYAMIDSDDKIPFWKIVGETVHQYDCRYILQLSHSGRQQDIAGAENQFRSPGSSTNRMDFFHGILCHSMSQAEIQETVAQFAAGALRAQQAGLDGVELHGANGYLITQFLSSGINNRRDGYGGSVENRARFALEIVREIRKKVGPNFHLQMKINGMDHNDWLYPWIPRGNNLEETIHICRILEDGGEGVDAFHISSGSTFPHPRNPPGDFPVKAARRWYEAMLNSGVLTQRNHAIFKSPLLSSVFRRYWVWRRGQIVEGINAQYAHKIRQHVTVPVICTGGFQHASAIADVIQAGQCDAVSMARSLIANPNLPNTLRHSDGPERECTYCNKCLINDLENPLGCYELSRYDGTSFDERYENMINTVMSVFEPTIAERLNRVASDKDAKLTS